MSESVPQSERKKICLVLHATVDVRGVVFVKRDDPRERFEDYRHALKQWERAMTSTSSIFVENSGYDISELRAITGQSSLDRDSVSSCPLTDKIFHESLGKGYGRR